MSEIRENNLDYIKLCFNFFIKIVYIIIRMNLKNVINSIFLLIIKIIFHLINIYLKKFKSDTKEPSTNR